MSSSLIDRRGRPERPRFFSRRFLFLARSLTRLAKALLDLDNLNRRQLPSAALSRRVLGKELPRHGPNFSGSIATREAFRLPKQLDSDLGWRVGTDHTLQA